ncbi:MAG: PKD domain-containing protein, partial [Tunicatimonas sp.]|uniref:PKD domain-containing protein n=1 Tax=Tunicatimonas sp. TaxID=1940096 RepID=UPI003C7921B7
MKYILMTVFKSNKKWVLIGLFSLLHLLVTDKTVAETFHFKSDGHLKAVEMDWGDTLVYQLKNGQARTFVLQRTAAEPIYIYDLPKNQWRSGCIYKMQAELLCEGQPLTLHRIVSAQQSYYEPYHIHGVTLFFDAVNDIETFIKDNHGSSGSRSFPRKKCRLAFIEMGSLFAPQQLRPWFPLADNFLDVRESYEGADTWLGGYKKDEAHNGLDVNVPNNTPLWAPIDFDNQYYFNSKAKGDNNNRWKGIRNWENGEQWILRTHHMTELHVRERTPVSQSKKYGEVGGTHYGSHPHVHFFFQWNKGEQQLPLDPWIIFWKMFENNRQRSGKIRAEMAPFQIMKTGEQLVLDGRGSQAGVRGNGNLRYHWSVSDGGFYEGAFASHAFTQAGVHAVTLLVTDGTDSCSFTQQISVLPGGEEVPYLRLSSSNLQDFRRRSPSDVDMYGV